MRSSGQVNRFRFRRRRVSGKNEPNPFFYFEPFFGKKNIGPEGGKLSIIIANKEAEKLPGFLEQKSNNTRHLFELRKD